MPEYTEGTESLTFPDGNYTFVVADAGETKAKTSGATMIELQLDCFDNDPAQTVRVVDRLIFLPNTYWKIDSFRRATGETLTPGKLASLEAEDCVDRRGRCTLKNTTYEGRNRNEVAFYLEDQAAPPPASQGAVPKSNQPF
jgi:hypothetical protein